MDSVTNGILDNLQYWHWWLFAIVLVILEVFSPAAFFLWMGAAAGVTGLVLLVLPDLSWQFQFVLFAVMSIISILAGRTFFNKKSDHTDDPTVSQLENELIGNVYTVETAIKNGSGRVKVGETTWKVKGPDCKAGSSVKVVSVKGAVLQVDAV